MASPEQEPETTSSPAPLLLGLSVWAGLSGVARGLCKYTPTLGGMEAEKGFSMTRPGEWSAPCQTNASPSSSYPSAVV